MYYSRPIKERLSTRYFSATADPKITRITTTSTSAHGREKQGGNDAIEGEISSELRAWANFPKVKSYAAAAAAAVYNGDDSYSAPHDADGSA